MNDFFGHEQKSISQTFSAVDDIENDFSFTRKLSPFVACFLILSSLRTNVRMSSAFVVRVLTLFLIALFAHFPKKVSRNERKGESGFYSFLFLFFRFSFRRRIFPYIPFESFQFDDMQFDL